MLLEQITNSIPENPENLPYEVPNDNYQDEVPIGVLEFYV